MIPRDDVRTFYARIAAQRRRETIAQRCVWIAIGFMSAALLIGWLR